ncbi:unnamed protein product [Thelazia callipaeda]|uniref:Transposase n=1 Tax=Thelazia callipaeda TaxID=103827 RepID=A0A0N5CTA5_THECL|nr:unnamed protein product [Thelazia callipaeda]
MKNEAKMLKSRLMGELLEFHSRSVISHSVSPCRDLKKKFEAQYALFNEELCHVFEAEVR